MKNKEYINKASVLSRLNAQYSFLAKEYTHYDHYTNGYGDCMDAVDDFAEDVLEIVKCKDCKYFKPNDAFCYGECTCINGLTSPNDDDFCSYGKSKNVNA